MGSLAIDGLVSGLDTTTLINQLMSIESQPRVLLKAKVSTTQSLVNAFQNLNSSVASLATLARKTALPATIDLFTATASASSVSVTAGAGASAGAIDLSVTEASLAVVTVAAPGAVRRLVAVPAATSAADPRKTWKAPSAPVAAEVNWRR